NVGASSFAAKGRRAWREAWRPNIRDDTPEGAQTRAHLARVAAEEQKKSNRMAGAELSYRYEKSPIGANEEGGPPHEIMNYVPTTWPGARLPHVWLGDGSALHDKIGDGYTMLRLGSKADADPLARAFAKLNAPFSTLDVADHRVRDLYG